MDLDNVAQPPLKPAAGIIYMAIGLGVASLILLSILYVIKVVKQTRRVFKPLPICPPPKVPTTCEDVGMVEQPGCPTDFGCSLDGRYIGPRSCYSVQGNSPLLRPLSVADGEGLSGDWVSAHNRRRTSFKSATGQEIGPLEWSDDLAKKAELYAGEIIAKRTTEPFTDAGKAACLSGGACGTGGCGSNVAVLDARNATPEMALAKWYGSQCPKYNGSFSPETTGYTQAVWRRATRVGCFTKNASPLFVDDTELSSGGVSVCVYDAKNVGDFRENVPPASSCVQIQPTLSGAGSDGLSRAYRADAELAAASSGGDGVITTA